MSAKPYSDEEISAARSHLARLSNADKRNGDIIAVARDVERRWLATVDALQSRLAAAEAEAERNLKAALAWDAQAIGTALGMKIGTDVPGAVVPAIEAIQSRLAAAEAERDDLRRYRKSWDKELRDARDAARAAIDGRIAAEAEADRARGLLEQARRCVDQTIELGWESSDELLGRIDAHLAAAAKEAR